MQTDCMAIYDIMKCVCTGDDVRYPFLQFIEPQGIYAALKFNRSRCDLCGWSIS